MPFTLTMPKLSPTMEEGTIAKWHKSEGEFVEAGELLIEVATDKATVEHSALDEGYLRKRLVKEGDSAHVNQPIAIFTESVEESIAEYKPVELQVEGPKGEAEEKSSSTPSQAAEEQQKPAPRASMEKPRFVPMPPMERVDFPRRDEGRGERLKASPLARKIAEEKGLDLSTVKGSGPGGRIMKGDLEKAQPLGDFTFGDRSTPSIPSGSYKEVKLDQMRRAIGRRLQEAKSFIPHFYVKQTVDAEPLIKMREELRNLDLKVSYNDCIVRASALALRKHPEANSGYNSESESIVLYKTIDISVAVSIEGGLITPIIRYADYKNIGEISQEIRALAQRAKRGKLAPHEFQGGSFTLSNLGMYGVTDFQAIINPPQSCILAVGGMLDSPVVKGGKVVPGKIMHITLSADHRVVDGVAGARLLNTIKFYLENPASLLL